MEAERRIEVDILKLVEQLGLSKEKMLESVFNDTHKNQLHNVSK